MNKSLSQEYHPLKIGTIYKYAYIEKKLGYENSVIYTNYSNNKEITSETISYLNKIYTKFGGYYYYYDSLTKILNIKLDANKIACDFSKNNIIQNLYYNNSQRDYFVFKDSILLNGKMKNRYTIQYQYTIIPPPPESYPVETFAGYYMFLEGIGMYKSYEYFFHSDHDTKSGYDKKYELYEIKINGQIISLISPPKISAVTMLSMNNLAIDFVSNSALFEDSLICERRKDGESSFRYHGRISGKLLQYVDYDINDGETYYYRFRKKHDSTYSLYSDTVKYSVLPIVKNLSQIDTSLANVTITWNYASSITPKFIVERKPAESSGGFETVDTVCEGQLQYIDTNKFMSYTYKYRILPLYNGQVGIYSNEIKAYPKVNLNADIRMNVNFSDDENAIVKWTNKNPNLTKYTIQKRLVMKGEPFTDLHAIIDDTIFVDRSLIPKTLYEYRVILSWGRSNLIISDTIRFLSGEFLEIKDPSNLSGQIANNKVKLIWTDNSNNESFYRIYRGKDSSNITFYKQLPKNSTTFIDSASELTGPNALKYYNIRGVNSHNFSNPVGVSIILSDIDILYENEFYLSQNYPNPFNPRTIISFKIPERTWVRLKIFNSLGEEVSIPISKELDSGVYEYEFDGKNLTSGVYLYQIVTNKSFITKKMIIQK